MYLVSVGTTKFDSLIEAVDRLMLPGGILQIADGSYIPKNNQYVRFTDNLPALMERADFIISHAGAGILFESLQRHKKVICVPNMERSDTHQIDLAEELHQRGMVLLLRHVGELKNAIEILHEFSPREFDIPTFQIGTFCKLAGIQDYHTIAILASGGGHLEEARILANLLLAHNDTISVDLYIPFNNKVEMSTSRHSFTVQFHPYNAKFRADLLGWLRFLTSLIPTLSSSLTTKIPRRTDYVISVGTADTIILFARLGWLGAKRILVESRARVSSVSHTVKLLKIFNPLIFKQWNSSPLNAPALGVLFDLSRQ